MYELSQKFFFEAAHTLHRTIDATGSRRIHGHTYQAEITILGTPTDNSGMVQDLGQVRQKIELIKSELDHQFLDEVPNLGPATLENLCKYIYIRMIIHCPDLLAVAVERPSSGDKCILHKRYMSN